MNKAGLPEGAIHLMSSFLPILCCHSPKSWEAGDFESVAKVEVSSAVPFTFEGENRIRPSLYLAVYAAGEMNAQKRKTRIGDRIYQVLYQVAARMSDLVVFTAKRHDLQINFRAAHGGNTIA